MAVMGNGDIVVGKKPTKPSKNPVIVENLVKRAGAPAPSEPVPAREEHCGAMSQQRCDSGAISTPQKFLRLVGCHEPKTRSEAPSTKRPETKSKARPRGTR
jgi:hypothetical protein